MPISQHSVKSFKRSHSTPYHHFWSPLQHWRWRAISSGKRFPQVSSETTHQKLKSFSSEAGEFFIRISAEIEIGIPPDISRENFPGTPEVVSTKTHYGNSSGIRVGFASVIPQVNISRVISPEIPSKISARIGLWNSPGKWRVGFVGL